MRIGVQEKPYCVSITAEQNFIAHLAKFKYRTHARFYVSLLSLLSEGIFKNLFDKS